ncbi:hypothetical protein BHM03_00056731 [Ensete ventricosum]|nr:hypothetical protein BHM03_00056731 [Ensete ventricosum]
MRRGGGDGRDRKLKDPLRESPTRRAGINVSRSGKIALMARFPLCFPTLGSSPNTLYRCVHRTFLYSYTVPYTWVCIRE